MSKKGKVYFVKTRNRCRVYFPCEPKPLWINKYLNGRPMTTVEQGERILAILNGQVDAGTFDRSTWEKDKLLSFNNAWRDYQNQATCGQARKQDRERIFEDFLKPFFGNMFLDEIEEHHVKKWFSELPAHFKPSYRMLLRKTLTAFLESHSTTRRKRMKYPSVTIPRPDPPHLSEDEQERVFRAIPDQHKAIFRFLFTYGCRSSEACNLKRGDINWQTRTIILRERKNGVDNPLPIMPEVEKYLAGGGAELTARGSRACGGTAVRLGGSPLSGTSPAIINFTYVFSTATGGQYSRQVLYLILREALARAGLEPMPLKNATRHTVACSLINKGVSIPEIARLLGNSVSVVERTYARVSTETVAQVLQLRKVQQK